MLLRNAGQYTETLDAVLKHDSRRISKLVSCTGYIENSAVQVEAIRITQFLAARQPTLADMLVQQRPNTGEHHLTQTHLLRGPEAAAMPPQYTSNQYDASQRRLLNSTFLSSLAHVLDL